MPGKATSAKALRHPSNQCGGSEMRPKVAGDEVRQVTGPASADFVGLGPFASTQGKRGATAGFWQKRDKT